MWFTAHLSMTINRRVRSIILTCRAELGGVGRQESNLTVFSHRVFHVYLR
nr:MAG TPA: hypothetical protein [Caudoviricetes sp.]